MREDLDYIIRHAYQEPPSHNLKSAFNRTLLDAKLASADIPAETLIDYKNFGQIVLFRKAPVKPFFTYKFEQAATRLKAALH